ncbi:MAG: hypothetical protein JO026_00665 [Patescibacteria group bacterium]|nr:hypothetical protein [Patescibacteria group bacterium]
MVLQSWADVLTQSFYNLGTGIILFLPKVVLAIIIFILGWLIGAALGKIVEQVIKAVKLDEGLRTTGLNDAVTRAGFTLNSGALLGGLVKWFVIIVVLTASLEILNLQQVNVFLETVVLSYLPQVIIAVLMIIVGAVVAEIARDVVAGAARAAGVRTANLAGSVAKWAIWIFTILAALAQLQVATTLVTTLFQGIVIAISLAVGLAFGLGGQDAAARYLEKLRSDIGPR